MFGVTVWRSGKSRIARVIATLSYWSNQNITKLVEFFVRQHEGLSSAELLPIFNGYSALMPANLITFVHFSVASERIVPNSAGVPPSTVPPSLVILA